MKKFTILLTILMAAIASAGQSWARILIVPQDYQTIQIGIENSRNRDTVLVMPGRYTECIDLGRRANGIRNIVLCSMYLMTGDERYVDSTIIDGSRDSCVVMVRDRQDSTTMIAGFTITNGLDGGDRGNEWPMNPHGGGVTCREDSEAKFAHCRIVGNESTHEGGGVLTFQCFRPVVFDHCEISNNLAGTGAGIYADGCMTIRDCVIEGNVSSGEGGGIYSYALSFSMYNTRIAHNRASSSRDGGGIILNHNAGELVNCQVLNNEAGASGGVLLGSNDYMSLDHCVISGNRATAWNGYGAGLCVSNTYPVLTNCTIVNNAGDNWAAGVFCANNGRVRISSSIVWSNTPAQIGFKSNGDPNSCTAIYSDIEGGRDSVDAGNNGQVVWGETNLNEDPRFADFRNGDYHLNSRSPCIDMGSQGIAHDPDGTRADMGVFYFHQRDIDVEPVELHFPLVNWGELDSLPVLIKNVGGTNLIITDFVHPLYHTCVWPAELLTPHEIAPNSSHTLWVYIRPDSSVQFIRTNFIIVSNDPDEDSLQVSASGEWPNSISIAPFHPSSFILHPCSPNPFNSTTAISYTLRSSGRYSLKVVDITGRMVAKLTDGWQKAGNYRVAWNGAGVAAGAYHILLQAPDGLQTTSVRLVK